MRRADRLLQIIQLLRRLKPPVAGYRLAEELEVSLRTVYRDIAALITSGVPVEGRGRGWLAVRPWRWRSGRRSPQRDCENHDRYS